MDKKLIAHSFYLSLIFQSNIYALGSYLYCTNTNASPQEITIKGTGWDWAKGSDKDNILQEYNVGVASWSIAQATWGKISFHYLQKSGYAFGYCSDIN
jgi:hypothetical protein